ncbi:MAG: TIGR04100 family radical SAM protein [Firmicutes bacterium]|nr:TIGR04100 family radical SAM protein [[Eubacterium] siraeum]MCM1488842.1 TIGR04100 family radical SAM protein [Bacillota bacterium]
MTIFYKFDGKLYANITNQCPCACTFCIRKNSDSVGDNDSLWLEHEPSYEEITAAFDSFDKTGLDELVFCGYGEPMMRAHMLVRVAEYVKSHSSMSIRINTNGLIDFMEPLFDISALKYKVDKVSISLNASDPDKYFQITNPKYGLPSYNAMLNFALRIQEFVPDVSFTVVDTDLDREEIEKCRERAKDLGVPLRVRHYVKDNVKYE